MTLVSIQESLQLRQELGCLELELVKMGVAKEGLVPSHEMELEERKGKKKAFPLASQHEEYHPLGHMKGDRRAWSMLALRNHPYKVEFSSLMRGLVVKKQTRKRRSCQRLHH